MYYVNKMSTITMQFIKGKELWRFSACFSEPFAVWSHRKGRF